MLTLLLLLMLTLLLLLMLLMLMSSLMFQRRTSTSRTLGAPRISDTVAASTAPETASEEREHMMLTLGLGLCVCYLRNYLYLFHRICVYVLY